MKKNTSSASCPFGPQLSKFSQIEVSKKVKKLIHYDCEGGVDDDVPDEDEIYIKENLLTRKGDTATEPGDDLSIVNINVSVLYSSEGGDNSNSKNSLTLNYSSDSRKKNSTSNSKLSQINNTNSTLVNNNNNANLTNNSSSNITNQSNKSENTGNIKDVISKRKVLMEKQKLKEKQKETISSNNKENVNLFNKSNTLNNNTHNFNNFNTPHSNTTGDELLDLVGDYDYSNFNKNNNKVKITNITNIIVGPKSFDIKAKRNDNMLRDIKALHVITQKALSTNSKHNPIDSIDDERKSFFHFQNANSKKALFIDDNSDLPAGIGKEYQLTNTSRNENYSNSFTFSNSDSNANKKEKQIINIININNNYNISSINMPQVENNITNTNYNNYFPYNTNTSQQSKKSFRSMNINNYKKAYSHIPEGSAANNLNVLNTLNASNTLTSLNAENPNDSARSNMSNKTLRKLIPKNSNNNTVTSSKEMNSVNQIYPQMNNKSIKDIIKSVKKDQKNGKFIKLVK